MGVEIPERLRRRRRHASSTRCWRSRRCRGSTRPSASLVDVQNTLVINALLRWGNDDDQAARYLPTLARGTVGAYALSEAGSGSDAFALTTRAARDGDGFVARRPQAVDHQRATRRTSSSSSRRVNPEAGYRGITAFIVERGTPGFTVGKKEDKLGIRASSTCELLFEDCRVPQAQRARRGRQGLQGRDRDAQRRAHRHRRADARARRRARSSTRSRYTKERKQFGKADRGVPGRAVPARARAATDVEAARLLGLQRRAPARRAASRSSTEAAMCKIFASEVAERVASLAVNLFGGNGFVKDYPVEKLYRDAKIGQIYEGTSNLHGCRRSRKAVGAAVVGAGFRLARAGSKAGAPAACEAAVRRRPLRCSATQSAAGERLERPRVLRELLEDVAFAKRLGADDLRGAGDGALRRLGGGQLRHRRLGERDIGDRSAACCTSSIAASSSVAASAGVPAVCSLPPAPVRP